MSFTRITCKNLGPCTPLMRVISMSAVALGPEIQVTSAGGFSQRAKYSGSVSTIWLARKTHRCQSGSSVMTRRPSVAE